MFKRCTSITFWAIHGLFMLFTHLSVAQKLPDDYSLKRSLKQGDLHYEFKVLDEDKHGVWFYSNTKFYAWYKAQKVLTTQGASSGRLLHGDCNVYYRNKQLAERGYYRKGLKHGEWRYWNEDGYLNASEEWSKGKQNRVFLYDENGDISETILNKSRKSTREFGDTTLIEFTNGKTILTVEEEGKKIYREQRKNGKLHGKVERFENGKSIELKQYKNGEEVIKEQKEPRSKSKEKDVEKASETTEEKSRFAWFKKLFKKGEKSEQKKSEREKRKHDRKKEN